MKKISLIAFAASLLISTVSCEDDDTPQYVVPNYLVGQWNVVQQGVLADGNIVEYGDVLTAGVCELDHVVFNEDYSFAETDNTVNGTVCESSVNAGTYTLAGRNLTLTSVDGPETLTSELTVVSLTFEVLEVSFTDAESEEMIFLKLNKNVANQEN